MRPCVGASKAIIEGAAQAMRTHGQDQEGLMVVAEEEAVDRLGGRVQDAMVGVDVVVAVLALEDGDNVGVVGGLLMLRHPMVG